MDEIQTLKKEVSDLKKLVQVLVFSDRYVFQKNLQFMDGRNIQTGKGTGTKVGTEVTQKLGFFGVAPVVQQGVVTPASGGATIDGPARTAINAVITRLQALGFLA